MSIINFIASPLASPASLGNGFVNDSNESIIRKFLSPALAGPGWDALIAGLARGDANSEIQARRAFDQLFLSSASGLFLDRRGSDQGFSKPAHIGMSDTVYRQLVIKTKANKIVLSSILNVLEAYYGQEATRAYSQSSLAEPYSLTAGDQLWVSIDGQDAIPITFESDDFGLISQAKATEVAASITRGLAAADSAAWAVAYKDPEDGLQYIRIFSGKLGLGGRVSVVGGRAQNLFGFPTAITTTQAVGTTWTVSLPITGVVRFTYTGGTDPSLWKVKVGDYVNVYGSVFQSANRGTLTVTAVTTTYFEAASLTAVNQAGVVQTSISDIKFFQPTVRSILSVDRMATAVQPEPGALNVVLPATSTAVSREELTAAYLHDNTALQITAGSRTSSGIVTLTTSASHGLAVNDWVRVENLRVDNTAPSWTSWVTADDLPATNTWLSKASVTTGRQYLAAAAVGTKVYAIGGWNGTSTTYDVNEAYDVTTNTWTTKAVMVAARREISAVSVGTKIYVIGGRTSAGTYNAATQIYDTVTNNWTTGSAMTTARSQMGMAAVGTTIYCVGGRKPSMSNNNEAYDTVGDTWTTKAVLPAGRAELGCAAFGDKVYAIGGTTGSAVDTNEVYDPITNTWSTKTIMPAARFGFGIAKAGNKIFCIGGSDDFGAATANNYVYDPLTDSWATETSMPTARKFLAAAAVDDTLIFCVGGAAALTTNEVYYVSPGGARQAAIVKLSNGNIFVSGGAPGLTSAYVMDSGTYTWTSVGPMAVGRYGHTATVLNDGKVLIVGGTTSVITEIYDPQTGIWTTTGSLNRERRGHTATLLKDGRVVVVGGLPGDEHDWPCIETYNQQTGLWTPEQTLKLYAVGGLDGGGEKNTNEAYDAIANTWAIKTNMTTARRALGVSSVGTKVYAIGGYLSGVLTTNEAFDTVTNTWTTKAAMTTARQQLATAAVGTKIYAIGGYDASPLNTNEEYDTVANTWATKAAMTTARNYLSLAVVGTSIYAIGGFNGGHLTTNEQYDTVANTWATRASMSVGRSQLGAAAVGTKIYAIGGYDGDEKNTNEEYDTVANTWATKAVMTTARAWPAVAAIGSKVHVVGGRETSPLTYYTLNEAYDTLTNTWATKTAMSVGRAILGAAVVPEVFNVKSHAASRLHDGRVLYCGGEAGITNSYVFNPTTSAVTQTLTPMNTGRQNHTLVSTSIGTSGNVYAFGGSNSAGITLKSVEVFNPATLKWDACVDMLSYRQNFDAVNLVNNRVFLAGGYDSHVGGSTGASEVYDLINQLPTADSQALMVHADARSVLIDNTRALVFGGGTGPEVWSQRTSVYAAGRTGDFVRVTATPTSTSFSYSTDVGASTFLSGGTSTAVKATGNGVRGPYVFNEKVTPPLTGYESTTTAILAAGQTYKILDVVSTAAFPDSEGYLCLGFGTDNEVQGLRYLARISATQLLLDQTQIIPKTIPVGATVTLLTQRGAWEPQNTKELGAFWLTASTAGLVAARQTIADVTASGLNTNEEIVYPGDKGLGNAGQPVSGVTKIADKVGIWGQDDIDTETRIARGS